MYNLPNRESLWRFINLASAVAAAIGARYRQLTWGRQAGQHFYRADYMSKLGSRQSLQSSPVACVEYRVLVLPGEPELQQHALDDAALDGWRLVSVDAGNAYLMREYNDGIALPVF